MNNHSDWDKKEMTFEAKELKQASLVTPFFSFLKLSLKNSFVSAIFIIILSKCDIKCFFCLNIVFRLFIVSYLPSLICIFSVWRAEESEYFQF